MLSKVTEFLTPARRKAIYGLVAAIIALLLALGVITAEQLDASTDAIVKVIAALTALMAYLNTEA